MLLFQIPVECQQCKLTRRGPDAQAHLEVPLTETLKARFYGTTLHFRGDLTPQPLKDEEGNILLWNGEIFGGIEVNNIIY